MLNDLFDYVLDIDTYLFYNSVEEISEEAGVNVQEVAAWLRLNGYTRD